MKVHYRGEKITGILKRNGQYLDYKTLCDLVFLKDSPYHPDAKKSLTDNKEKVTCKLCLKSINKLTLTK